MRMTNVQAFQDLKVRGFGANYTGSKFSTVHGDLVTEYFNPETKGTAGPFRLGYSNNVDLVNNWVGTAHIHAKLRIAMREKLNIKTSSTHKEVTEGGKKKHDTHVKSLKETINTNPFDNGPVKVLTTGVEAEVNMVNGLLEPPNMGNKKFLEFVNNCFIKKTRSIFFPLTKLN